MDRNQFVVSSMIMSGVNLLKKPTLRNNKRLPELEMDDLTDIEGHFRLQSLPFSEDYLEPFMDAQTVNVHYKFHHGGAVIAANHDLEMIKNHLESNHLENIDYWTQKLSHHLSSHVLHTIFWSNLTRERTKPKGTFLKRIDKHFGSFENMKALLSRTTKNIEGNGWGILGYQPYWDKLIILGCEDHDKLSQTGAIPILAIDACEHAYYLKYQNRKQDFIEDLFHIINWENVGERLDSAIQQMK